ncbi:ATP-binding protein [Paucibacter sp. R3-3]|uniref:histidine kinase n=1 Tax=Roseateles agri TaxID=3098619 RepID=A0ABU5DGD9_9BURK|nr:ATP-binding protein [Paucibacter sp. R3-3]MDY0745357.1 ATP-binding protein [Paucibacter sp. R3-3]
MKPPLASLLRVPSLVSLQTYLSAVMLVATVPLALLVAYHVFNTLQSQHQRMRGELQHTADLLSATLANERNDAAGLQALLARNAPAGGAITVSDAGGQLLARAGSQVDEDSYTAAGTVPGKGWQVGVTLPRAQIDEVERRMLLAALATITACLLLGLALATLAARRVTDPLRELATQGPGGAMAQPDKVTEIAGLREALARAQAELQRKAAEFEMLFASTPIGLAFLRGGETMHNAAMDRLIGTPADAAAGKLWQAGAQPAELALRLPDGGVRHLLVQAVPLEGHVDGPAALASAVDITERKQAEQRMQETDRQLQETQRLIDLAQEAGEVGFFHIDERGAGWTPGLSRLFGFDGSVPPALQLAELLERVHEDDRDAVEQGLRDMAAGLRERGTLEYRVTLTDSNGPAGEPPATRWLSSRVQMGFGPGGRPLRLIGATLNVNEQKALELERLALAQMERRARIEAEDANRAKDEFLAMLGHELRNPLGAIASASEVLAQLGSAPPAKAAALGESARAIIARQTRQLARLVDDLLDIGRVISGKVTMSRQRFDMAALVNRAVENFRLTGSADRHELVQRLAPAWIEADATRIEQVINNLLGNALKYTPAGRRIELQLNVEGQHQAVLRVIDHGDGISPLLLPHIFDLFVQGERLLDRSAGGLGVGLTLVRRLVEMHAGTVTVESSPQGSIFTVRLPAALDQPAAGTPDEQNVQYHASAHGVPPCRVLVIEDNEDARTTLCTMLELDGHSVSTAADGRQGLSLLLGEKPDVAVVDIGLPGLSGFELARESRRSGYAGRLLALSGYGSDADVAQALRHGFDAHLAKPVDPQRLRDLLAAHG